MQRGDIYWVELPIPRGNEPGYRRPMLVVQADYLNRSRLPTVMLCPLTSNLRLADNPDNVLVKSRESGLSRDSVVLVHSVMTINRSELSSLVGHIPGHLMLTIDMGLGNALALS